jgi:6-phosphogluconolactonase (cycloisomerase 2 family)
MKKYSLIFLGVCASLISIAQPTITSFSPASGPVGTIDTIFGTNFSTTAASNIVYFGATRATVSSAIATRLIVTVPASATFQFITVQTGGLTAYSSKPFIVTFTSSGGGFSSSTFASKVDFTSGSYPSSVAVGDLDGDGKPDVAVANSLSNTVSVFRDSSTSGSVSFAARVDFTTGFVPNGVAISDLDGDGKPDMAVTNYNSTTVSVFRNTSTGSGSVSFAAKVDYTTGTNPLSIKISDMDGDGKSDLVVANYGSNTVSVFRNGSTSGTISFATKVDFTTRGRPSGVALGDLNADGKPDIAVTNNDSNYVSVFKNTGTSGTISFATRVDIATGTSPTGDAIGDLDGDGNAELVVNWASAVSVYRNTTSSGSISFAAKVDYTTGSGPTIVNIGNMDGDGKPDLAVANYNSNTVSIFKNGSSSGTISFASKVDYGTGSGPTDVAIADIDADGKPDLTVANQTATTISVLRNTGVFLPVKLISFTGLPGAADTYLTWTTASELNNDHFEIERTYCDPAAGQPAWESIGSVKGNGTTSHMHTYMFTDASARQHALQTVYYRLKQVDLDGRFSYSGIISVSFDDITPGYSTLILAPNPSNGILQLQNYTTAMSVEVFNLAGKKVYEAIVQPPAAQLDLHLLDKGIYILRCLSEQGAVSRKIMVE